MSIIVHGCCGCSCHVCSAGHNTGRHTVPCQARLLNVKIPEANVTDSPEVKCPWCHELNRDLGEYGEGTHEIQCGHCNARLVLSVRVSSSYELSPLLPTESESEMVAALVGKFGSDWLDNHPEVLEEYLSLVERKNG